MENMVDKQKANLAVSWPKSKWSNSDEARLLEPHRHLWFMEQQHLRGVHGPIATYPQGTRESNPLVFIFLCLATEESL